MASRPTLYADSEPVEAPTGESAPPCRNEVLLADKIRGLEFSEWEMLGRHEREFLAETFRLTYLGKGAIVFALSRALQRTSPGFEKPFRDLLADTLDRQLEHIEALAIWNAHLDGEDVAGREDVRDSNDDQLAYLFGSLCRTPDLGDGRGGEFDRRAAALALLRATFGVFTPTGYRGIEIFCERNGALPRCAEFVSALAASDARQFERTSEYMAGLENRDSSTMEAYEALVEDALLPYVELIRQFQHAFDFLELGLVPDEFVAYALDRFFEIG